MNQGAMVPRGSGVGYDVRRHRAGTGYLHVARRPPFSRVVPGLLLSGVGDGISLVALPWIALDLARGKDAALLVAAALACFQLPGALAVPILSRVLQRVPGNRLAAADGLLRAAGLAVIPLLAAMHELTGTRLLVALSASSVLCAWGIAGRFSFVAEAVNERQRLTANTIALTGRQAASLLGAMVAGVLVTHVGAALAIGIDAITFAVLGIGYLITSPVGGTSKPPADRTSVPVSAPARAGFAALGRSTPLRLLVGLSVVQSLCLGAARAAVPLMVVLTWHGQAALLGSFWTVAGIGAVLGGLLTRFVGRRSAWPLMTGIVAGGGGLLGLVALTPHPLTAVVLFGLTNAITAPLIPMAFAMTQLLSPPGQLRSTLAARSSLLLLSSPLGSAAGGAMISVSTPAVAMAVAATVMMSAATCYWLLGRQVAALHQASAPSAKLTAAPNRKPAPAPAALLAVGRRERTSL